VGTAISVGHERHRVARRRASAAVQKTACADAKPGDPRKVVPLTIDDLTAEEDRLLQYIEALSPRPFKERAALLRVEGIMSRYDVVYHAYARLATELTSDDEALKRALFLQWVAFVEPTEFTGIDTLDKDTQRTVLEAVQQRITEANAHGELLWMLRWYDSITEWYFDDFPDLPLLWRFRQDKHNAIHLADIFTQERLQGRGQMGAYWLEMLQGQERNRLREAEGFSQN